MDKQRTDEAIRLMDGFAQRTGLTGNARPRRYLWTDAFAVCNFLGLARLTGESRFAALARDLVHQVHHTLGRHRGGDGRTGWISGFSEQEGEAHPTAGGLRIGKALAERAPAAPYDAQMEWERDGQYFHYLTKWANALDLVARTTGHAQYNLWARELLHAACSAFIHLPTSDDRHPRMVWKMSIDLSRPLVASMGQHDPLDGYLTALQICATAAALRAASSGPDLERHIAHLAAMVAEDVDASADPLGIGGLLMDAYRLAQIAQQGAPPPPGLCEAILRAASSGLQHYQHTGEWRQPATHRLAFRELGLAIGLKSVRLMGEAAAKHDLRLLTHPAARASLQAIREALLLGDEIESFWRNRSHRHGGGWIEHEDINEVMLATCLVPEGMLVLSSVHIGAEVTQ